MMTLHDDKLVNLIDFEGIGLSQDQQNYIKVLAIEAGWGAWATDKSLVLRSQVYLKGLMTNPKELTDYAIVLLKLAAYDPDHEWEAPHLTGQSTEFA
ncbi:MAG TPA: hypothetical protein VN042_00120, partial [Asticcacaulis sp.]|nr:hypothetical protein [Asticcacaulis sp.]